MIRAGAAAASHRVCARLDYPGYQGGHVLGGVGIDDLSLLDLGDSRIDVGENGFGGGAAF